MSDTNDDFSFEGSRATTSTAKPILRKGGARAAASKAVLVEKPEPIDEPSIEEISSQVDQAAGNEEEIKTPDYDETELDTIFDEIVFTGVYSEEALIRGRLPIRFQTRNAGQLNTITREIDALKANFAVTTQEYRAFQNIVYSLIEYNGKDLSTLKLEERAKFVSELPGPIMAILLQKLFDFDLKVLAACKRGEENF